MHQKKCTIFIVFLWISREPPDSSETLSEATLCRCALQRIALSRAHFLEGVSSDCWLQSMGLKISIDISINDISIDISIDGLLPYPSA